MPCTDNIPVVSFDECDPSVIFSQIQDIFIGRSDIADFTDWSQLSEWTPRLSQTGTTGSEIRRLNTVSDLALPEQTELEISSFDGVARKKSSPGVFTLNINIDDLSADNYTFGRNFSQGKSAKIWFKDSAGNIYGGNEGIKGTLKLNLLVAADKNTRQIFQGTFTWEATQPPLRIASPV